MSRVGFVGAGRMGGPMVARLTRAGHQVRALGRSADRCAAIKELAAQPVTTTAELVNGADLVVVCVFTDQQVNEVCGAELLGAMREGAVLVIHTTASPRTVEAIATAAPHIDVVDAPVSGGPHDVAAGRVTLFVGGDDRPVDRIRPVLACYGDPVLHVGPLGAGQRVKLVNNAMFAAQIGLVAEAVSLGARLGVAESTLLRALPHGSAGSRPLSGIAAAGSVAAFTRAVGGFVGKDIAAIRATVTDLGGLEHLVNRGLSCSPHSEGECR